MPDGYLVDDYGVALETEDERRRRLGLPPADAATVPIVFEAPEVPLQQTDPSAPPGVQGSPPAWAQPVTAGSRLPYAPAVFEDDYAGAPAWQRPAGQGWAPPVEPDEPETEPFLPIDFTDSEEPDTAPQGEAVAFQFEDQPDAPLLTGREPLLLEDDAEPVPTLTVAESRITADEPPDVAALARREGQDEAEQEAEERVQAFRRSALRALESEEEELLRETRPLPLPGRQRFAPGASPEAREDTVLGEPEASEYWGEAGTRQQPTPVVPTTTVEGLASLPRLDFAQFGDEGSALGYQAADARDTLQARDEAQASAATPYTRADLAQEIRRNLPMKDQATLTRRPMTDDQLLDAYAATADTTIDKLLEQENARRQAAPAAIQQAIDEADRSLATRDYRLRADSARLGGIIENDRRARARAGDDLISVQLGATPGVGVVRGKVEDGVFVPAAPLPQSDRLPLLAKLQQQGFTVSEIAPYTVADLQGRDAPNISGIARAESPLEFGLEALKTAAGSVLGSGTTILQVGLLPLTIPGQEAKFGLGELWSRIPNPTPENEALRQQIIALPYDDRRKIYDALISTFKDNRLEDMAADLRGGMKAEDVAAKYRNPWTEAVAEIAIDPLNYANFVANGARAFLGKGTTRGLVDLEGNVTRNAFTAATARVSTRNSTMPWENIGVLNRFSASKAAASREYANVVGAHVQSVANHIGVENVGQYLDDLATLGAEGAAAKWNLLHPTEAMQYARQAAEGLTTKEGKRIAGGLADAAKAEGSRLKTVLERPVYDDAARPWDTLSAQEQRELSKKMYASQQEKLASILDTVEADANVVARRGYGLDASKDPAIVRLQANYRGALSTVYLTNPRYHIRNALGDLVTGLMYGQSAWRRSSHVADVLKEFGEARGLEGFLPSGDGVKAIRQAPWWNPIGRAQQWAGKLEGARRDTLLASWLERLYPQFRDASIEETRSLLQGLPPAVQDQLLSLSRTARSAKEFSAVARPRGGGLTAAAVLGDLDDGAAMSKGLRSKLDSLAQRAARGENVSGDVAQLIDEATEHANNAINQIAEGVTVTPGDVRRVFDEVRDAIASGTAREQAVGDVVGRFAEDINQRVRIAQMSEEVSERLKAIDDIGVRSRLLRESEALDQARRSRVGALIQETDQRRKQAYSIGGYRSPEREAAVREFKAWRQQAWAQLEARNIKDLDGFLMKTRRASGDADIKATKDIDKAIAQKEARLANLRTQRDTIAQQESESIVGAAAGPLPLRPSLPRNLADATPRYGYGSRLFEVVFGDDVERAAYIVRNRAKRSPRDQEYMRFVTSAMGMDEDAARALGDQVAARLKERAANAPPGETVIRLSADPGLAQSRLSVNQASRTPRGKARLEAEIRDLEEEIANLRGQSTIPPPEGVNGHPFAATGIATQNLLDALHVLHFDDQLQGAVQAWKSGAAEWGALTPEQARQVRQFIDAQAARVQRDREGTRQAALAMVNHVLHNYNRTNDLDFLLRWISPWELWGTRTFYKTFLRAADKPQYYATYQILKDALHESNQDRPEYLRDKFKIPFPGLPSWAGDHLFFDPVSLFVPTEMFKNEIYNDQQPEMAKRARLAAGLVNIAPGPVTDAAMSLAGGGSLWDVLRRNPITDGWSAASSTLNKLGLPVASRPIVTELDLKNARRQLAMMVANGEVSAKDATAASLALDQNFREGFSLLSPKMDNEIADRALNRALQRQTITAGMGLMGVLGPVLETQAERERGQAGGYLENGQFKEDGDKTGLYQKLEEAQRQGGDAVNRFYRENPEFAFWTKTGLEPKQHGLLMSDSLFYQERADILKERDAALAALPMFGTDQDKARIRKETDAKIAALTERTKEANPDWNPERVQSEKSHVDQLVRRIFDMPVPRDSNGVADFEKLKEQRNAAISAVENSLPALLADTGHAPPANIRAQVEAAMLPKDPKQAAARAYEDAYYAALDQRNQAGKNAKTREEATRARQAFTETWKPPTPEQIADAVEKKHPGKYDRDAVLAAAKSGNVPGNMDAFAALNEQERIAKFRATMNEKGVSEEPFYVDKNNGVSPIVIKTEGDLQNYLGAKADDQQYRDRRARNDPTYVLFDTERRQRWLLSGEDGAQLWRQEQAILEFALGPQSPTTGQRTGGGKGWTAEFRFPNGEKMKAIDAYKLINKFQDDLSKKQNPDSGSLPSEKADASKQTAAANQSVRSSTSTARSTTRSTRSSGSSRGGSGARGSVDPGPRPGAVRWFDDSQLRRDRLTGADGQPAVNIREEWRKGAGLTPEAFAAFIKRNPDADAAIAEMEKRQQAMGTPNIDLNAATAAVQEQALAVSAALEQARAKDQERKAGPPTPALTNINDSYLKASRIRTGVVDFDRAFRTGTSGLGSEQKWAEFLQRHPDVKASISALQKAADALKTTDEYPDDTAQLLALYDQTANVAAMITAGKEADAENERARKEAERDAKNEAEREAKKQENARIEGPPRPAISNINDAWLKPERLRLGVTDFNYAFRLGTSGLGAQTAWDSFLAKHPPVQQAIAALQTDANRLKSSRRDPDDAAAMMAFYDRVAAVSDLISTARQADSDARTAARAEQRQRERDQERADRQDSRRGATVGFAEGWTGGPAAGRRKARAEAAARRRR